MRAREDSLHDPGAGARGNAAPLGKDPDHKLMSRQMTTLTKNQALAKPNDGYQLSLTDVMSIGTKHRASFTQLSNDVQLQQMNNQLGK